MWFGKESGKSGAGGDPQEDLTPVTTRGGDDGRSGLLDGSRRFKDDPVFDALGYVDETQVALGCCRAVAGAPETASDPLVKSLVGQIEQEQYKLLVAGGVMACPVNVPFVAGQEIITDADVARLEERITWWRQRAELEPRFFVAGDSLLGAECDRARTVVRRAERAVVRVVRAQGREEQKAVSRYLNRLSDWFFILARWADKGFPLAD
ncbi:ATP:cob(I)alamin adenosyltransferase [Alkalispirochaeta americana]|nr:ATP:cob(I)alamin adenosyltransferase [Alkalispirochaeta americana]